MWIRTYKPYTPSRRYMTWYTFEEITKKRPEKSLTKFIWSKWWRNNRWRITVRFRWGWHKKLYRILDFKWYDKLNIPAKVISIEYDPYRTARIALVCYADWEKRYVIAWKWANVWDSIMVWDQAGLWGGNRKILKDIPDGFNIHCLEVIPQTKWKLLRSAWAYWVMSGRDERLKIVFVKMTSWEVRKFNENCWATIGIVGNEEKKNITIWKAWRQRWLWKKPRVLGKSMNPVDHPHGWWEWHTPIGMKYPKSFTGKPVPAWKKTRKKHKWSDSFIVKSRKK